MAIDDFDKHDLEAIADLVGLERGDDEDWIPFIIRVIQAFDQPMLKTKYGPTIERLVGIASRFRQEYSLPERPSNYT